MPLGPLLADLASRYAPRMTDDDSSGARLTPRERRMLSEYRALMHKTCVEWWPNAYADAQACSHWTRFPQTPQLANNTQNLMLTLARDPLLAEIEHGTAFPRRGRSGWASRLWPNQRWMLPSPFYGAGFMTRRILFPRQAKHDRREWLTLRQPIVFMLTLHHIEFESDESTPLWKVSRGIAGARSRWNELLPVIYRHVGLGGIVGWDLAPRVRGREKPRLQIHLHAVIEPYMNRPRRPPRGERPREAVEEAWERSARAGHLRNATLGRPSHGPEHAIRQIKYASGLTQIGGRLYPKFMRGFVAENRADKKPRSGGHVDKPTPHQLRLIHAAYMSEPVFSPRWFGLWDFNRRRAIRDIEGRSPKEMLVNSIRARTLLGVQHDEPA